MTTINKRATKISFPFGLYFKQLFATDTYVKFINPFNFWRKYKINHLETCREFNLVKYLERCYRREWRSPKLSNFKINKNSTAISTYNHFLFKPAPNTTLIFQPSTKLKYRGVTYYTKETLIVNINNVQLDPGLVEPNSLQQPLNSDNTNAPEKSGSN